MNIETGSQAATAELLQSGLTPCNAIDGSS